MQTKYKNEYLAIFFSMRIGWIAMRIYSWVVWTILFRFFSLDAMRTLLIYCKMQKWHNLSIFHVLCSQLSFHSSQNNLYFISSSFLELKVSLQLLHCPILTLVLTNHISHASIHSSAMQGTVRVHIIM